MSERMGEFRQNTRGEAVLELSTLFRLIATIHRKEKKFVRRKKEKKGSGGVGRGKREAEQEAKKTNVKNNHPLAAP